MPLRSTPSTTAVRSALTGYGILPDSAVGTFNLAMGILLASSVALVLLGGIKRIGSVAEKLVPFMALLYILLSFGVVFSIWKMFPAYFPQSSREHSLLLLSPAEW